MDGGDTGLIGPEENLNMIMYSDLFAHDTIRRGIKGYSKKQLIQRRCLDVLITTLFLPYLLPKAIRGIFSIMKNDPAKPVGFRQDRIGEFGKLIKMYKLRTMVVGAEDMLEDVLEQGFEKDGFSPEKNDPRVTSYGRPLRDSHVDEFPQLINILSGDMSIVGNRPVSYHEIRRIAFENGELKKTLLAINVYMHQAAQ